MFLFGIGPLPNLSTCLQPLNYLLKNDTEWKWSDECKRSFAQIKKLLISVPVLVHYNPELPNRFAGDASAYGIGVVISH